MKHYEYTYLTRPDMTEDEAKKLQDELAVSIQAKNGVITDLPKSYKKRLAYRVKSQVAAYVNTILFQMEPAGLEAFKKETDGIAEILRGLIIFYNPEKMKEKPRRERGGAAGAAAKATSEEAAKVEAETAAEPAKIRAEEPKEEKTAGEEKKEAEEAKPAKPKRRLKAKAELADIEEKLDEILK